MFSRPAERKERALRRYGASLPALCACLILIGCDDNTAVPDSAARAEIACRGTSSATANGGAALRDISQGIFTRDSRDTVIRPRSVAALKSAFAQNDYNIDHVREHRRPVPRLIPAHMPGDIKHVEKTDAKKAIFIATVLPSILHNNERILCERRYVRKLKQKTGQGGALSRKERKTLKSLHRYYKSRGDIDVLLKRADIVPPSLAIAQAAIESGWGTSRFATDGNALFGQHTTNPEAGLRPKGHTGNASLHVRAFASLTDSVAAYARNLNTHRAYGEFRSRRATLRRQQSVLDGVRLAETLVHYSERGAAYLHALKLIIRSNRLHVFDTAQLEQTVPFAERRESDA